MTRSWARNRKSFFSVTLFRLTIDAEMINFEDEVRSKYQQSEEINEDSVIEKATNMKQNQVLLDPNQFIKHSSSEGSPMDDSLEE